MKKRLIGLMTALALLLSATAATAAAPLTLQEIVDRVVVPMALENDTEETGRNRYFSHEQLAEIVRVMEENGITLPENNTVMQYVTSGCGYYESSVVGYFCDQVFGPSDTWTDEEQSWYDGLEVRMGHTEEQISHVPGKDNMTREEAVALADVCPVHHRLSDIHRRGRRMVGLADPEGHRPRAIRCFVR